jgi:hypothetical protein
LRSWWLKLTTEDTKKAQRATETFTFNKPGKVIIAHDQLTISKDLDSFE